MANDLDIYRTANVLVKHYGEDAALEAAQRAPISCSRRAAWTGSACERVLAAVEEIQREEPREGEAVN